MNNLAIITCIFNPCKYINPLNNYFKFKDSIAKQGGELFTGELVFGNDSFLLPIDEHSIKFRSNSILWHKESILNEMVKQLPAHFTKIAWIDNDIIFSDFNWINETVNMLDKYKIIQLFERINFTKDNSIISSNWSAGKILTAKFLRTFPNHSPKVSPGGAWAAQRDFFDKCGLFEKMIVGGGDRITFKALHGINSTKNLSVSRQEELNLYINKVFNWCQSDVGFLPQTVTHLWHGESQNRQYDKRQLLISNLESHDLKKENNVLEWDTQNKELIERVSNYFVERKEDGNIN